MVKRESSHKPRVAHSRTLNVYLLLSTVRRLSVRPSRFSIRTHILVTDFQILLSFYRFMYLHMRTARKMFRCTAQTGNRVTTLCYFQIYIVDRYTFCTDAYLVMDFQILLSPVVDFDGHIVLALSVRPSSFRPSDLPAMDLGKLTKGAL